MLESCYSLVLSPPPTTSDQTWMLLVLGLPTILPCHLRICLLLVARLPQTTYKQEDQLFQSFTLLRKLETEDSSQDKHVLTTSPRRVVWSNVTTAIHLLLISLRLPVSLHALIAEAVPPFTIGPANYCYRWQRRCV